MSNYPALIQEFEQLFSGRKDQGLTVYDEKNNIVVEAHMPGLKPEEIEINLNKGVLWIKGEQKEEKTDKEKKFYKKSTRSFAYTISLPDQIEEKQEPEASYKDGVLKIAFQKAKTSGSKKISIKSENGAKQTSKK